MRRTALEEEKQDSAIVSLLIPHYYVLPLILVLHYELGNEADRYRLCRVHI